MSFVGVTVQNGKCYLMKNYAFDLIEAVWFLRKFMLSADYRFEVENLYLFALCREFLFSEMFSLFSQISEFYQSALIFSENTVIFAEAAMWIASISCALSFLVSGYVFITQLHLSYNIYTQQSCRKAIYPSVLRLSFTGTVICVKLYILITG